MKLTPNTTNLFIVTVVALIVFAGVQVMSTGSWDPMKLISFLLGALIMWFLARD